MFDQPLSVREPRVPLRWAPGGGMPTGLPRQGSMRREFADASHPHGLRVGNQQYFLRGRQWVVEPLSFRRPGRRAVLRDIQSGIADYWLAGESLATAVDRMLAQYGHHITGPSVYQHAAERAA